MYLVWFSELVWVVVGLSVFWSVVCMRCVVECVWCVVWWLVVFMMVVVMLFIVMLLWLILIVWLIRLGIGFWIFSILSV